jgi:Na+-transporting NADH:ubiquinone oxidoreductase subunit C
MMRDKSWYPVVYMFIVMVVFSSIVIGVGAATRERVLANERLAFEKAVVNAMGLAGEGRLSNQAIHEIFKSRVKKPSEATAGAYYIEEGGAINGYGVPIEGRGFWDQISGVIGVAADKKTVTGIYFYEQHETPGLGAVITTAGFRRQFEGLELSASGKPIAVRRPGTELGPGQVHAVTGATQTSTRLDLFMNEDVAQWQVEMGTREGVK